MSRDPLDLARLNDAERQVLRLLAEGHTAKSIANALGSTPAAVNERLREARRKTGVGSSRELARLLRSQENRDEQMGVAGETGSDAPDSHRTAATQRRGKGALVMAGLLVVAIGTAGLLMQQPSEVGAIDPLIGAALPRFEDPARLHSQVRTEKRDDEWPPRVEEAVHARLLRIPLVGKGGNALRVTCASTLCEIAGTLAVPVPRSKAYDPNSRFSLTIRDLQDKPLADDLEKLGLASKAGTFTSAKGKPDRSVFMLYYSRAK